MSGKRDFWDELFGVLFLIGLGGVAGWSAAKHVPTWLAAKDAPKETVKTSGADPDRKSPARIHLDTARTLRYVYHDNHAEFFVQHGRPARTAYQREVAVSSTVDAALRRAGCVPWKDTDAAIAAYTEVLALDANCADAYAMRGMLLVMKKDYQKAIADYSEAMRIGDFDRYLKRGDLYMRTGEFDRAIADYTRVINRFDDRTHGQIEAYTRRGIAYTIKGEERSAREDFEKVAEFNGEK
jgi:tetratricopeptide (TPR) repeat protein